MAKFSVKTQSDIENLTNNEVVSAQTQNTLRSSLPKKLQKENLFEAKFKQVAVGGPIRA